MTNRPMAHRVPRVVTTWRRHWLHVVVLAALLAALITGGQPADAGTTGTTNPGCSEVNTASFSPGCLPPRLLTLSGLYAATSDQATSLLDLENQAIANTINDHGLASTDDNAVLSWARPDAEAELLALIVQAIDTPATSQTPDQQNAVAWVQAVEQREAEVAAQDAGLEYVKWAGLDQSAYSSLIAANAGESDLQSFLSSTPEPFAQWGRLLHVPAAFTGPIGVQPPRRPVRGAAASAASLAARRRRATTSSPSGVRQTRTTRCRPPSRPCRRALRSRLAWTSAPLSWAPGWAPWHSVAAWPPRSSGRPCRRPSSPTRPGSTLTDETG